MKITFKGDYATKIVLDLSVRYGRGAIRIRDIAKRQDIPQKFLEQLVTILKSAGYIKTSRGPSGGVSLAKDPADITLGEIVRLMEGTTSPITCVSKSAPARCSFERRCVLIGVWREVRDRINEIVDHITFRDLAKREHELESSNVSDYNI